MHDSFSYFFFFFNFNSVDLQVYVAVSHPRPAQHSRHRRSSGGLPAYPPTYPPSPPAPLPLCMPLTLLNLKRKVNVLLDTPNSLPFGKCKRGNRITKYVSTQCLPKHCSWSVPPNPHCSPSVPLYYSDHIKKDIQQQRKNGRERVRETHSQVPKEVEKTSPFRFVCLQRHPLPNYPHSPPFHLLMVLPLTLIVPCVGEPANILCLFAFPALDTLI